MNPTPSQIGVSLALEAHRRGFVSDGGLEAVLRYYSSEGSERPEPPELVLRRLGGLADAQVQEVLRAASALVGVAPPPPSSPARPSSHVGRTLSARLTLHERLGAGAMGTVFRGHDRILQRDVAVKLLKLDDVDDPARRELRLRRFEREAKVMARVRHPGVVAVHDAGFSPEGEPYLVLELVQGQSLAGRLRDPQPVDPGQVAGWGAELADALEACHVAGVVHRDVKPANVLIDSEGRARLTDFGVAHDDAARTRLTAEHGAVGTLAYMAPEQLSGREPDARTDIYALGATLHEALTGGSLFDAPHAALLLRKIVEAAPPPVRPKRADCPPELEAVVLRCLAKDPAERYQTAGQLARALRGEPPLARGRRRRARGLPRLAWIAGAPLLAGLTALAVARRPGSKPHDATLAEPGSRSATAPSAPPSVAPPPPVATATEASPSGTGRLVVRGSEVVNEKDGSVLVWVAPGTYILGSDHGEENERPARRHELKRGFHIGKLEVTVGALDMTGNMYEWCADSIEEGGEVHRPIRGSAWNMTLWSGRCSARAWVRPTRGFGFRAARDAD